MIVKNGGIWLGRSILMNNNVVATGTVYWNNGAANQTNWSTATNATKTAVINRIDETTGIGITMFLGVGSTPLTVDDIWLDETDVDGEDINDIIQMQTANIGEGANGKVTYTFSFINTGDVQTIREIALAIVPPNTTTDPRNKRCVMIARKLIPARTVQPAETITFTYELSPCGGA